MRYELPGLSVSWSEDVPADVGGVDTEKIRINVERVLKASVEAFPGIMEAEKAVVGFSGGKDSLTCALVAATLLREEMGWNVSLVTVDPMLHGRYLWRPFIGTLKAMAKALGVPFEYVRLNEDVGKIAESRDSPVCKVCSALRRRELARRGDVVLYGHTAEDVLETLLLSASRARGAGTFPPADVLEEDDAFLFRPIYSVSEERTRRVYDAFLEAVGLDPVDPGCPHSKYGEGTPRALAARLVEWWKREFPMRKEFVVENVARGLARMALAEASSPLRDRLEEYL